MLQCDGKLMTKEKALGFKPTPQPEQIGDEHSKRVQHSKHRSMLRNIHADDANLSHGRLLCSGLRHLYLGTAMPSGASTPSVTPLGMRKPPTD
jgi:hypothetical protein